MIATNDRHQFRLTRRTSQTYKEALGPPRYGIIAESPDSLMIKSVSANLIIQNKWIVNFEEVKFLKNESDARTVKWVMPHHY